MYTDIKLYRLFVLSKFHKPYYMFQSTKKINTRNTIITKFRKESIEYKSWPNPVYSIQDAITTVTIQKSITYY